MKVQSINNNLTFNAGLTKQMKSEISACKVDNIEKLFAKNNISTDFKNNKVLAWCCAKCFQFVKELNRKYNLNLGVPEGIFAEDFRELKNINEYSAGFTNFAPAYLYRKKDVIVPEKTIFFNTNEIDWNEIDSIADKCFERGISATDFFLENILHEFMHVIHESNLLKKLDGEEVVKRLISICDPAYLDNFLLKHSKSLSKICHYAASNPMETVACDLANRGVKSINKENLSATGNIFKSSPYEKKLHIGIKRETKNDILLRRFWNGNFSV